MLSSVDKIQFLLVSCPNFANFVVPNDGVNYFAFFVGTRMEEETNQLCIVLRLVLEYGMVTSAILLHQSISCPNFAK